MKLISTLCLLFIAALSFAQVGDTEKVVVTGKCWGKTKPAELKVDSLSRAETKCGNGATKPYSSYRAVLRCPAAIPPNQLPLLVIDGVIAENSDLQQLRPQDIDSIWVLKDPEASAIYGYQGANGVIIITTKLHLRQFIIKDQTDSTELAGATLKLVSADRRDSVFLVANDSGFVSTRKLRSSTRYTLTVSAIGHFTKNILYETFTLSDKDEVLLDRDIKICSAVVLSDSYRSRILRCGISGLMIYNTTPFTAGEQPLDKRLHIYPNPVRKGERFTVSFNSDANSPVMINLFNMNGQIVRTISPSSNDKSNTLVISTDPNWAPGTYILRLSYENGSVAASGKIIIQ